MKGDSISLQINLAPGDFNHAKFLLLHQIKILSAQVSEIVLTIDTKQSKGRFAEGWVENKDKLELFLEGVVASEKKIKILYVNYSKQEKRRISDFFFGTSTIPDKDYRGGPFYAYFFGLYHASNSHVFHIDSDIFIGGGSQKWLKEAQSLYSSIENCFVISPLPGPPHPQELLYKQCIIQRIAPFMFELEGMSTRIFLIDKNRFCKHKLKFKKPSMKNQIRAILEGNSNAELPEVIISAYIKKYNLKRIDFLGSGRGFWSLHPPYRNKEFYQKLPNIISSIESNNFPESQKGFYDINNELCDWSDAIERIKRNRLWRRVLKKLF